VRAGLLIGLLALGWAAPGVAGETAVRVPQRAEAWGRALVTLGNLGLTVRLANREQGLILADIEDHYSPSADRFSAEGLKRRGKVRDWATCPGRSYIAVGAYSSVSVGFEGADPDARMILRTDFRERQTRGKSLLTLETQDVACESTGVIERAILSAAGAAP
jgi:hypothetical protein